MKKSVAEKPKVLAAAGVPSSGVPDKAMKPCGKFIISPAPNMRKSWE